MTRSAPRTYYTKKKLRTAFVEEILVKSPGIKALSSPRAFK